MSEPCGVIHLYEAQSLSVYYVVNEIVASITLNPGDNYVESADVLDALISHPTLECLEGTKILSISDYRQLDTQENNTIGLVTTQTNSGKEIPVSVVGASGKAEIQKAPLKEKAE